MIVYKLTDKDGYCQRNQPGETLYEIGKTYTSDGNGGLYTRHWRHAYEHPLLAVLHDPIHGAYGKTARLWECDTLDGTVKKDGMMKLGTSKLKVLREIEKPQVNTEQRVAYAIACSLRVYAEESYVIWAENWLSGKDKSKESAAAACMAADAEADAAAWHAASGAAYAVNAKMDSVWSSAWSSADIGAAFAAWSSAEIEAALAAYAAELEESSTARAAKSDETLNLLDCAREVFLIE